MPVIAVPVAALLLCLPLLAWYPLWALPPVLLIAALLALTVNFFRDPKRRIGAGLVSPADGVLRRAEVTARGAFFSVFMNIHDVHVNRAPWSGRVVEVVRIPGGHAAAYKKEASANERVRITMETALGRVIVTQVVGMVARRIVPYVRAGRKVRKGDRIGMIRFGSRVDLFVPSEGLVLKVRKGERVLAGTTTLAELETGAAEDPDAEADAGKGGGDQDEEGKGGGDQDEEDTDGGEPGDGEPVASGGALERKAGAERPGAGPERNKRKGKGRAR